MYGLLDVSYSGMVAQRARIDVAASNIANQDALRDSSGRLNPYRRREAILASGRKGAGVASGEDAVRGFGVHIAQISISQAEPQPVKFDPGHPDAYQEGPYKGWVPTTGINSVYEQVNAMEAARAYEANIMAAEATKQMIAASLRLIG